MKKKKAKKRNPNDLTLRNLRAMKKRIETLEECLSSHIRDSRRFLLFYKQNMLTDSWADKLDEWMDEA